MSLLSDIGLGHTTDATPGTFTDPFTATNVERIMIWIGRRPVTGGLNIHADVKFSRGDTSGEHTIRADTVEALLPLIRTFIEGLPK